MVRDTVIMRRDFIKYLAGSVLGIMTCDYIASVSDVVGDCVSNFVEDDKRVFYRNDARALREFEIDCRCFRDWYNKF